MPSELQPRLHPDHPDHPWKVFISKGFQWAGWKTVHPDHPDHPDQNLINKKPLSISFLIKYKIY